MIKPRLARELGRQTLVERLTPRLHEHDRPRVVGPDRLHRFEHGLGLDHHARAAAERHVVDLPVAVVRVVAKVVGMELDEPALDRAADDTLLEYRREHARKDRHDVKSHLSHASST